MILSRSIKTGDKITGQGLLWPTFLINFSCLALLRHPEQ